ERAGAFDRFQARGPRRERPTVGHGHDEDWLAPGAEYYPPGSAVPEPQSRQEPEHGQRGMAAKAADTMYAAREKAGAWAHSAREGIASARERLGDIGGRARERIGDMSHRAREGAMHLGEQARHGARVA